MHIHHLILFAKKAIRVLDNWAIIILTKITFGFPTAHMLTFLSSPPVTITRPEVGPSDRHETFDPCATNSSAYWNKGAEFRQSVLLQLNFYQLTCTECRFLIKCAAYLRVFTVVFHLTSWVITSQQQHSKRGDCMANFSPGWNYTLPRAEILLRLHDEFQPGFKHNFSIAAILFRWILHQCACSNSRFNLGWNFAGITWGFSAFQPGMNIFSTGLKIPAQIRNLLHEIATLISRGFLSEPSWNLSLANRAEIRHVITSKGSV